ncbi:MAG: porin family protein [Bacteroidales bacterium]|nr:porin family protein [Bacteroidales bacterium]
MKRLFAAGLMTLCLWTLMPAVAVAQRSEIGLLAGGSFYLGDINPKRLFSQTRAAGGLYYRYNINTRWAFRLGVTYGRIQADDKHFDNPRNLNFRNDLFDVAATMEVNFLNFFIGSERQYRFTPYLTAGAAVCFHNPKGYYFNPSNDRTEWVALQPLHTEGQGLSDGPKNYSLTQFALPFGIGLRYSISSRVAIGVEWTMRLVFSDYLDDVSGVYADPGRLMAEYGPLSSHFGDPADVQHAIGSQRGDKNTFDWYSFAGITVSVKLGRTREECPAYSTSAIQRYKRKNL